MIHIKKLVLDNLIYIKYILNMPQKILRLGFTESTLLFIYWLKYHKNITNTNLSNMNKEFIKWLYTTSGYYDKTQIGTYFNVRHTEIPVIYKQYMECLLNFIKNADIFMQSPHNIDLTHFNEYKKQINAKHESFISKEIVFDFIKNKKILILSPFSKLITSQINCENCKHIYTDFPNVESCLDYTFPYTFFNNGPHNNILETVEHIFNDINKTIKNNYDSVLISCGAYSCLMAKKFYDMNKNVCVVGGDITTYFGIISKRIENHNFENKKYWINIPNEYKPKDYMKIENGCYW
jgi:hypothetical protein